MFTTTAPNELSQLVLAQGLPADHIVPLLIPLCAGLKSRVLAATAE